MTYFTMDFVVFIKNHFCTCILGKMDKKKGLKAIYKKNAIRFQRCFRFKVGLKVCLDP